YLIKRSIEPLIAPVCGQPIAQEAIRQRTAYLNSRRTDLYEFGLYLVLVYEAPTAVRTSTQLSRLWRTPRAALQNWLSTSHAVALIESDLDRALANLGHKADAVEVQI